MNAKAMDVVRHILRERYPNPPEGKFMRYEMRDVISCLDTDDMLRLLALVMTTTKRETETMTQIACIEEQMQSRLKQIRKEREYERYNQ